jgi:hypothetical protein
MIEDILHVHWADGRYSRTGEAGKGENACDRQNLEKMAGCAEFSGLREGFLTGRRLTAPRSGLPSSSAGGPPAVALEDEAEMLQAGEVQVLQMGAPRRVQLDVQQLAEVQDRRLQAQALALVDAQALAIVLIRP